MDDSDVPPLFAWRLSRGQLIALDGLVAVAYTVARLWLAIATAGSPVPVWLECLVIAGIGLPLAGRRLWPLPVFGIVLVTSLLSLLLGMASDSFVATALALYLVALTRPRRRWEPTLAIALLSATGGAGVVLASSRTGGWMTLALSGSVILGGAWTVGRAVRARRAYAARAADRAVTEERLRIARELHDVVAHSLGVIAVKAGIANHLAQERPEAALDALRVIEATSRDALGEMRHLLGVLRSDADSAPEGLVPAPGVASLPELTERAAVAGVRVSMDVRGVDHVPDGVGLSVYRIVQEAVTNVVKHAAPARCRVIVEADDREVRIEVTDDGPGHRVLPPAAEPGHGLVGMRERVATYGGTLTAGPRREGGFAVLASLPYRPAGTR